MAPQFSPSDPGVAVAKQRLREIAFRRRDGLATDARADASARICDTVLALPELVGRDPVGGYWPMRSEVDIRAALAAFALTGSTVALPQTCYPELIWRRWRPGDLLVRAGFGLREPGPDAEVVAPRALLVPLCAFDRAGGRIGYGKGHFDRSIAALSGRHDLVTIGIAFAVQEVETIPVESHDQRLGLVVTEAGVIRALA